MTNWTEEHWNCALLTFKYGITTRYYGIIYSRGLAVQAWCACSVCLCICSANEGQVRGIRNILLVCIVLVDFLVTAPLITGSGEGSVVGCVVCFLWLLCYFLRPRGRSPAPRFASLHRSGILPPAYQDNSRSWLQQDPSILDQESQPLVSSSKLQAHRQVLA